MLLLLGAAQHGKFPAQVVVGAVAVELVGEPVGLVLGAVH